jgi:hypothetical protein
MFVATRAEFNQLISDRLATDPSFADALVADPRAAISELFGVELPTGLVIDVHKESLAHLHIVIPVMNMSGPLADEDLELIAGGTAPHLYCVGCSAAQYPTYDPTPPLP